jgi:hypothetical protein
MTAAAPLRGTTSAPERVVATIAGPDLVEQLEYQVRAIVVQLAPQIVSAAENTRGTEKASATITITYNPGGEKSDARFDVGGKASIPAIGSSRTVAIEDSQLKMFEE